VDTETVLLEAQCLSGEREGGLGHDALTLCLAKLEAPLVHVETKAVFGAPQGQVGLFTS
jgi:hypothetical protein